MNVVLRGNDLSRGSHSRATTEGIQRLTQLGDVDGVIGVDACAHVDDAALQIVITQGNSIAFCNNRQVTQRNTVCGPRLYDALSTDREARVGRDACCRAQGESIHAESIHV
ncbi:hypothetical protein D3C71_1092450 [compost metagenome]